MPPTVHGLLEAAASARGGSTALRDDSESLSFADWEAAVVTSPPRYTKPQWATQDFYPFVEPYVDFASTFILERPADDFMRDLRAYVP